MWSPFFMSYSLKAITSSIKPSLQSKRWLGKMWLLASTFLPFAKRFRASKYYAMFVDSSAFTQKGLKLDDRRIEFYWILSRIENTLLILWASISTFDDYLDWLGGSVFTGLKKVLSGYLPSRKFSVQHYCFEGEELDDPCPTFTNRSPLPYVLHYFARIQARKSLLKDSYPRRNLIPQRNIDKLETGRQLSAKIYKVKRCLQLNNIILWLVVKLDFDTPWQVAIWAIQRQSVSFDLLTGSNDKRAYRISLTWMICTLDYLLNSNVGRSPRFHSPNW